VASLDELDRLRRRVSGLEVLEIERRHTQGALKEDKNRTYPLLNAPTESAIMMDVDEKGSRR
jgi:hypothetical protein